MIRTIGFCTGGEAAWYLYSTLYHAVSVDKMPLSELDIRVLIDSVAEPIARGTHGERADDPIMQRYAIDF